MSIEFKVVENINMASSMNNYFPMLTALSFESAFFQFSKLSFQNGNLPSLARMIQFEDQHGNKGFFWEYDEESKNRGVIGFMNGAEANLSTRDFGMAISLMVFSNLSFDDESGKCAEYYHILRNIIYDEADNKKGIIRFLD